jgi:hypothetical protein
MHKNIEIRRNSFKLTREEKYLLNHKINNDGEIERQCSQCNEWKPETLEYFYMKNKSKPEKGFSPECRICASKRARVIALKNPERTKNNVERWQKDNIVRYRTVRKEYNDNNKNKIYQDTTEWVNNNRKRANELSRQHRNHDITDGEWEACKDNFKNENGEWCCAYCGMPISDNWKMYRGKKIVFDFAKEHVDDNGTNDIRNCVPSCTSCNSSKSTKSLEEFLEFNLIKEFTQNKYNKIIKWITEGYKQYIEDKPPYKITRKQNEGLKTYHWELWSVDEGRDLISCLATSDKKANLKQYIDLYFNIAN